MGTLLEIGLGLAAGAAVVGGVLWYRRRQAELADLERFRRFGIRRVGTGTVSEGPRKGQTVTIVAPGARMRTA